MILRISKIDHSSQRTSHTRDRSLYNLMMEKKIAIYAVEPEVQRLRLFWRHTL